MGTQLARQRTPPCANHALSASLPPSGDETLRGMFEEGQQDVFELLAARWLKHGDGSQVGAAGRLKLRVQPKGHAVVG